MPTRRVPRRELGAQITDLEDAELGRLLDRMSDVEKVSLATTWEDWAHPAQLPPPGDWRVWLLMAGRGFGKTRAGAEWIDGVARRGGRETRIALVGASLSDARDVMVEGESGILSLVRQGPPPKWEPSLRRLTWPGGATAMLYSGAQPDMLRGPQHSHAWGDELAKWAHGRASWDNLMLGLRLGERPRVLVTTTPRPMALLRQLVARDDVAVTRGRTDENPALSADYVDAMRGDYGRTRFGRQELDGELLDDVVGALWTRDLIERSRVAAAPELVRVVIGVDPPAGSMSGKSGDACGIVACGLGRDGHGYVIEDASVAGQSPQGWARAVASAAARHGADRVVAEANNGGRMVGDVLRAADSALPVKLVHAARGTSVRALAESVGQVFPVICRDEGGARVRFAPVSVAAIIADDLGTSPEGKRVAKVLREVAPLETAAKTLSLGYVDPARDYQAGLQRVGREGSGPRDERVDLPAAFGAGAALRAATDALADRITARRRATVTLPWRAARLRPGDSFTLDGVEWRIAEMRLEQMVVHLDLVRYEARGTGTGSADPGRAVAERDAIHGPTVLRVLDLPPLTEVAASAPLQGVVAAGTEAGWRRASLLASMDGGASYTAIGVTALPATMGATLTALASGPVALIDRVNSVEVALLNGGMDLNDADTASLLGGANLALIGDELIQFGRAVQLPSGAWRLSELWRGRHGTDGVALAHAPGTAFTLIEAATIAPVPAAQTAAGVRVMASGLGDVAPFPEAVCATADRAMTPLAPVHLSATRLSSGDTATVWTRRSRAGWAWRDGVDAPLGEERELYRVLWTGGDVVVEAPAFTYTAAQRAADSAGGATVMTFEIRQVGSAAMSPPALLTIPLT